MTATAVTAADLTGDEVVELCRQRSELITRVEDAREDRSRLQLKLKALGIIWKTRKSSDIFIIFRAFRRKLFVPQQQRDMSRAVSR